MTDAPLNAFVDYRYARVAPARGGALHGCRLAVKDLFDVAGYPTGAGNPAIRAASGLKRSHASSVATLLASGAEFVGKTHLDEFAYAMNGENVHYGMPVNPRAPGRIPGGSSSGSASVVAGGAADIALATDTGGSVRMPASYCGLIGLRATHGRIPSDGLFPLARSLDTVGWFAKDMDLYRRVGNILLGPDPDYVEITNIRVASDITALVMGEEEGFAFEQGIDIIAKSVHTGPPLIVCSDGFETWLPLMRIIQAYEIWQDHGTLIEAIQPEIGPGIRERIQFARTVSREAYDAAQAKRAKMTTQVRSLVPPGTALAFPTVPAAAPKPGLAGQELERYRKRSISMLCLAGLAGLPQLTLPIAEVGGMPFGISLLGSEGSDQSLLSLGEIIISKYE